MFSKRFTEEFKLEAIKTNHLAGFSRCRSVSKARCLNAHSLSMGEKYSQPEPARIAANE